MALTTRLGCLPRGWHPTGMRAAIVLGCLTGLIASCRCGEELEALEADIAVEPSAIDFGPSAVGVTASAGITVGNRGSGRLTLSASVEPEGVGFGVGSAPEEVGAGLAADGAVRFTPVGRAAVSADLVLRSNDPDTPELRVPLQGQGGPPELVIDPTPIELGLVNQGTGASVAVRLINTGLDVMTLRSAALSSATLADGGAFTLDAASVPASVPPGGEVAVTVALAPVAAHAALLDGTGVLRDRLVVTHAEGAAEAPITAQINLAPVAVAVELVTRRDVVKVGVGTAVTIDGSETADPEGDPFSFAWAVTERPGTSAAAPIGQGQPTTRVTPDVVGAYRVVLRATDVRGAFGDADVEILPRDLSVVLTWLTGASAPCRAYTDAECASLPDDQRRQLCCGQSDLDLHLMRPSGTLGDYGTCPGGCDPAQCAELVDDNAATCRQLGGDCAYANRAPEWGTAGRVDDPRLDVDDVRGDGPEIVSIDDPEDGAYRVVVHYCLDRIGEPALATVEILEQGISVHTTAAEPIIEGDAWTAATLVRSGGSWQVVAPSGVVEAAPPGLCSQ